MVLDPSTGNSQYQPLSLFRSHLAESCDPPDPFTIIFNIRKGVKWQNNAPMNGRELKSVANQAKITCEKEVRMGSDTIQITEVKERQILAR